jgi:uncharacterized protein YbjQ (UPF0145 family)
LSPLFRRTKAAAPTEEERQAAEVDLERIRQGGIPLGAEQRLKRVATASTPFFTSDLSAKEYAIAQLDGLQPLAQVMGSSVVQHGWGNQVGWFGGMQEVNSMSAPWNLARRRAFDRMQQEAAFAGADGVIGVELSTPRAIGSAQNVEYVVFGTAVRDTIHPPRRDGDIRMCALSGQEVDKLRRIGAEVCGVVGHTTVVSVGLQANSNYVFNSGGWLGGGARQNMEIVEVTQGVYEARRRAMSEVRHQATLAEANQIVISTLQHSIEHHEYERNDYKYHYFLVAMHVLGTAIRLGAYPPHPAPLKTPMLSINLRH